MIVDPLWWVCCMFTVFHAWCADQSRPCELCRGPLDGAVSAERRSGFECKECNLQYVRADKFLAHASRHSGVKIFCCSICPRSFTRRARLDEHVRHFHSKERMRPLVLPDF